MGVRQFSSGGLPVPLLMRGMGSTPRLVTTGYGAAIVEVIQRGFNKGGRKAKEMAEAAIDTYVVAAMLLSVNNVEMLHPEKKSISGNIDRDKNMVVRVEDFISRNVKKPAYRIVISALRVFKGGRDADD